jgi:osmoprotectant transport system permease protein
VREQLSLLPEYLSAHVRLTLSALVGGLLLAVPAGILARRWRGLEAPILAGAGVIQTVPALALLAVMVPLLSALGLPGIGTLPAFLALLLYSLLPILANTVAGLRAVDPAVIEAARGVGMTPGQRLRRVELPLALPIVVAGVRTAAVWTVGMATLSTPVGATSLGNYIFGGLQTRNLDAVLVGCLASASLALLVDGLVRALGGGLARRGRARALLASGGLLALAAWAFLLPAFSGPRSRGATPGPGPVRVGAKTFTEQYVLAEVLAQRIRAETHRTPSTLTSLGSTVAFDALCRDQIDLYVDYTGTLWSTVMHRASAPPSRLKLLEEVRAWLAGQRGVALVASLGFENAYAFALRRDTATKLGVRTLGELATVAPTLSLASDYEFFAREEWRAVERAYSLAFRARRTMDPSLLYPAIAAGQVDAITAYTSDGRLVTYDLVTMRDEKGALPPYDAVVLAAPGLARRAPDVVAAVAGLEGTIDVETMRDLNRQVDEGGKSPAAAAAGFLASLSRAAAQRR